MLTTLRRRDFARFWTAVLISVVGDWALLVGLPVFVYTLTGSALVTAGALGVSVIPRLLGGSIAGVLVDRWSRKWTMVAADLSRAALLWPLLIVDGPERIWIVYAVIAAQAVASLFWGPAQSALMPELLDPARLTTGNALFSVAMSVGRLVGPPLGGILMVWFGLPGPVVLDSASFALSALLVAGVAVKHSGASRTQMADAVRSVSLWARMRAEWREGAEMIRSRRTVAIVFLADGLAHVEYGIVSVLLVVFVERVLGGGALEYGWTAAAQGLGAIVGGLVLGSGRVRSSPGRAYGWCLVGSGLMFLAVSMTRSLGLTLSALLVAGGFVTGWVISGRTLLQADVPYGYRGRVFGTYATVTALLLLVGMGLAGMLADHIGPALVISIAGGAALAAGAIALLLLPHEQRARP